MNEKRNQPVEFREISPALEFCAWTSVLLAPLLRLVNGPAVTDDQWYLQIAAAALAVTAAVGLRAYHCRRRRAASDEAI